MEDPRLAFHRAQKEGRRSMSKILGLATKVRLMQGEYNCVFAECIAIHMA